MGEAGAFAHGLGTGSHIIAQRERQEIFDEAGALAAAGRRFAGAAHRVEAAIARRDAGDDLALADAVAAANLGIVRERCNGRLRVQRAASSGEGLTKDQQVANVGDVLALPEQVEIPAAIRRVAIEHGADDAVVLHDHALVDAARGIAQDDVLAPVAAREIAGGKDVEAGDLELGRCDRAPVAAMLVGEAVGEAAAHVPQGRDQAIDIAVMFDTFADRQHIRVAGYHMIVDLDAASDVQARFLRQRGRRANADRHHDEAGGNVAAVLQAHALDLALAVYFSGVGPGQDGLAACFQGGLEQPARRLVELPLHQRVHEVDNRDLHAAQGQAMRGFEAQQAAPDDHGVATGIGRREHGVDVLHVAEADDAGQILAGHRDDEGIGARGDQQLVIADGAAALASDGLGGAIDRRHRITRDQLYAIVGIPGGVIDDDVVKRLFPGQHRREHDAVIIHIGFGAEDGDAVAPRVARQQFLDRAAAGHAVAHHDQMFADILERHEDVIPAVRPAFVPDLHFHPRSFRKRKRPPSGPPGFEPESLDGGLAIICALAVLP